MQKSYLNYTQIINFEITETAEEPGASESGQYGHPKGILPSIIYDLTKKKFKFRKPKSANESGSHIEGK